MPYRRWVYLLRTWVNNRLIHLSASDIATIDAADTETVIRWYSEMNSLEWPKELLPDEAKRFVPGGRRIQLMDRIRDRVGEKALNRYHNRRTMTDEDHEDFWATCYRRGDMAAYEAFKQRCEERRLAALQ